MEAWVSLYKKQRQVHTPVLGQQERGMAEDGAADIDGGEGFRFQSV